MSKSYNHLNDIIRQQKQKDKIFNNSECCVCQYDFTTELKFQIVDGKKVIICDKCYKKATKKL